MRNIKPVRLLGRLLACALALAALTPVPIARAEEEKPVKLIAFTFDDGPSSHTPTLLDGLEARGVVATFFMCGANGAHGTVNHFDIVKRMAAMGCQMANHSYSHPNFTKLNATQIVGQLSGVEDYLYAAAGDEYLDLVRIPGGSNTPTIRANVAHPIILWSVDPMDWRDRNADTVYQRIVERAHDGAIVLLHDLYPTSIEGGLRAMDTLKEQGYTFVTVSEMFRRRGVYMENGVVYKSAPTAQSAGGTKPAYTAPWLEVSASAAEGITVTMGSPEPGVASIHYTTDGTLPTLASPKYAGPVSVYANTEFRAAGFDRFGTRTPVTVRTVQTSTAAPRIESADGGKITLSCATEHARILYTTDGEDPRTNGSVYTGAFTPGSVTKAVAVVTGRARSDVVEITKTKSGALFYDVPADAWYLDAVNDVVKQGLMNGVDPYVFEPESPLTRAAMVSVLYRMEGSPHRGTQSPFRDVPADAWCAEAVSWAAANGLIAGKTPDTFDPTGDLTRQQAATILHRYAMWTGRTGKASADLSPYPDADKVAEYAVDAMGWCLGNGMLRIDTDNRLAPEDPALRGQCALMVSVLGELR